MEKLLGASVSTYCLAENRIGWFINLISVRRQAPVSVFTPALITLSPTFFTITPQQRSEARRKKVTLTLNEHHAATAPRA